MKKNFLISLFFILPAVILPAAANAASLRVIANPPVAMIQQPVRVDIILNMQNESINAIQGSVIFPQGLFTLQSIKTGSSPISFWVDAPREIASGVVTFSGIVPNGWSKPSSSIISLILDPVASGTGTITLTDVSLLRNDGSGTAVPVAVIDQSITVSNEQASSSPTVPSLVRPELFMPEVAQDPDIYDGKYFLVFSTTDKGSGIDHYEVLEVSSGAAGGVVGKWQIASSPYLLTDQTLGSDIYVRAVDRDGNFIIVKLPASHPGAVSFSRYGWLGVLAVVIVIFCIVFFIIKA